MIDLSTFLKGAKAGDRISVPKSTYSLSTLLILSQAGLTLLGNGSTLLAPVSGSPFLLAAKNVILDGFNCEKCASNFANANESGCTVSNCNLGMESTTPAGSIAGGFGVTGSGATNFTVKGCNMGLVENYPFYMQQPSFSVIDCTAQGSLKQATIRWDTPDGKTIPTGLVVSGGQFWRKGATNVQTFEGRCGSGTLTGGVILNGDALHGQGTDATPPYVPGAMGDILLDGVVMQNLTPGNAPFAIRWGSNTTIKKATVQFLGLAPNEVAAVVSGGKLTWV